MTLPSFGVFGLIILVCLVHGETDGNGQGQNLTVLGVVKFGDGVNINKFNELLLKEYPPTVIVEDDNTIRGFSDPRISLCPNATDIAPCICIENMNGLNLACSHIQSEDQLNTIFQKDFPSKDFYQFGLDFSPNIFTLDDVFNNVTFHQIVMYDNSGLETITENLMVGCSDTMEYIHISNSSLTAETFPFETLGQFGRLEHLILQHGELESIPTLQSDSIYYATFSYNKIKTVTPGTFDGLTALTLLGLDSNNITSLVAGTFVLRDVETILYLSNNQISSIEPGTFVLPSTTDSFIFHIMFYNNELTEVPQDVFGDILPFIDSLYLDYNPLSCGCDVAWIILDSTNLERISTNTTCSDGRNMHDLDPNYYLTNC